LVNKIDNRGGTMDKYSKYVVYGPAIGLVLGGICGLIFSLITKQRISEDMLYGGVIGACGGWGFRSDYDKKHKVEKKQKDEENQKDEEK
jgi:hypothetical protein